MATAEQTKPQNAPTQEDDYESEDYISNDDDQLQPQQNAQRHRRRDQYQEEEEDGDFYSDEYSDGDYSDDYDDDYSDGEATAPGKAMQPYQPTQTISSRDNNAISNGSMNMANSSKKGADEEEGLKLKVDVNLDIEVELKARIHGDLTLSLLA